MRRQVLKFSVALMAAGLSVMPGLADELSEAIECEQFVAMSARQIPAGHPSEAEAKALLGAWTTHVRLLSGDADTLSEDRTAASQAIFSVAFQGNAAEREAYLATMQRCRAAPMIAEIAYSATTCAGYAKEAEGPAEGTVQHHEAKALGYQVEGNEEKRATALKLAAKAGERARLARKIRLAFSKAYPNKRVEPNAFGLYGEDGEPLLRSCIASMGLEE